MNGHRYFSMTEELQAKLAGMSEQEQRKFFAAVNATNESKAAFLQQFAGETVTLTQGESVNA